MGRGNSSGVSGRSEQWVFGQIGTEGGDQAQRWRGLARARHAGEYYELLLRDPEVGGAQIVLARAAAGRGAIRALSILNTRPPWNFSVFLSLTPADPTAEDTPDVS